MLEQLRKKLKGKVLIVGVGNIMRKDDGFGSILVQRLRNKVSFDVIDAGMALENYLMQISKIRPEKVVIIDTADMGRPTGEIELFVNKDVKSANLFSTHNASFSLTINFLKEQGIKDIILVMVQPKEISFGQGLSPELSLTVEKLTTLIVGELQDARC